jgi:hypothetical protein
MSRRDIVINTLLGIFLLVAAAFPFLAVVGAFWLALSAIRYLAGRFIPGLVIPTDLALLLVYGISALVGGVAHLRGKLWRNAFLCLAVIPLIVLAWFAYPSSIFGAGDFFSLPFVAVVLVISDRSVVPRSEFFLSAFILSAVVMVASGLVGADELARVIWTCTGAAAVVLIALRCRRLLASEETGAAPPSLA